MATWRQIVYMCLDEIKAIANDITVTEDHVIFLANQYRLFLIEQKRKKEGESYLTSANEQTICIDLEQVDAIPDLEYCNEIYLRSIQEVPTMVDPAKAKIYPVNYFNTRMTYVTKDRFKFVGFNPYMANIIYSTLGADNHIFLKGANPQFKYLKKATLTGVFEDSAAAAELACNPDGSTDNCDMLDQEFPLQAELIPQLIELLVKELLGMEYRPKDTQNDSADDLSDIVNFVRRQMKSNLAKQMTE